MHTKRFIVFAIIAFFVLSCQQNQAEEILQQEIARVQADARSLVNDSGSYWYNSSKYELNQPSRQRYLSILECLDSINQTCQIAQEQLRVLWQNAVESGRPILATAVSAQEVHRTLDSLKERVQFHYRDFFQSNYELFNLTKEEVEETQKRLDNELKPLNDPLIWQHITSVSQTLQLLTIQTMLLDWENVNTLLINRLGVGSFLGCNRSLMYYTLQVTPAQNTVYTGEIFEARISLLHNDDAYVHANMKVLVDGVELPLIDGYFAEYISQPLLQKEQTIHITALIENPLTGEMEEAFPNFEYTIKTE